MTLSMIYAILGGVGVYLIASGTHEKGLIREILILGGVTMFALFALRALR